MIRVLFRLIVTAEALIGSALMVLLLVGRTEPMVVSNTLTVIGVGVLALSIGPSTMVTTVRRRGGPLYAGRRGEVPLDQVGDVKVRSSGFVDRFGHLLRGVLMAGIIIGTGLLIEFSVFS